MPKKQSPETSKIEQDLITLQKTVQTLVIVVFVLVVAVGALFVKDSSLFKKQVAPTDQTAQPQQVTVNIDQIKSLFNKKNIVFGNKNSKNLFVEVSDPSCPYCHFASGENPELNKTAGPQFMMEQDGGTYIPPVKKMRELVDQGKAGFVWIYQNGHGNGELATKALYCAYDQGKFWEAHDLLMSNAGYTKLNDEVKNDMAQSSTLAEFLSPVLDANSLLQCLESGKYDGKISEDMSLAQSLGVQGTPGFFINTTNFSGAYSWKQMESALK